MTTPEQRIVQGYTERGLRLAFAETDTGGMAGARITSVPGSSKVFPGAVVAYSNRLKIGLLGVPEETLREHGSVSEQAVIAMAEGLRRATGADVGVAASGIAGPTGGSDAKPIGTVFIAIAREGSSSRAERHHFTGERNDVRAAFAEAMLNLAASVLEEPA